MTRTISIKKYLKLGLLIGLFAFMVGYSIFQTKALTKGVDLTLSGIKDGETFEKDIVNITGRALYANHLLINGNEILVDQDDNFSEELVLSPGYNIITIEAKDQFNKITQNTYRVLYKDESGNLTALNN
jgi:hypothetical protein